MKKIKEKFNNQHGFTLVELIVVVALLGVLLALAWQTFFFLQGAYTKAEDKWNDERTVSDVMECVINKVDKCFTIEIMNNVPTGNNNKKNYYFIFNEAKKVSTKYKNDSGNFIQQETFAPNGVPVKISFEKVTLDGETETAPNLVKIIVTAADSGYKQEQTLFLPNIDVKNNKSITGNQKGSVIAFKLTK